MKKLLILAMMALLLPVTVQYMAATFLLFWWLWRLWGERATPQALASQTNSKVTDECFRPIVVATCIHIFMTALAAVIAYVTVGESEQLRAAVSESYHLIAKQGVLGLVLIFAVAKVYAYGFRMPIVMRVFFIYVFVYLLYLLVQRYTGIDWVHGFDAMLPDNRFAYGVYRLSGFMGHPLSFAYNVVLCCVLMLSGAALSTRDGRARLQYWSCLWLLLFALAISGSRWPFLVALLLVSVASYRQVLAKWRLILLGSVLFAVFLYFEASLLGRVREIMISDAPLIDRFPRLAFWHVHWQIFVDHLFAGAGFGATEAVRLDYYVANGYTSIEHKFPAHNIFLQTLADSGLIGFMSLLVWLGGFSVSLYRAATRTKVKAILMLIPAVVLTGLFQNNLRDTEFLYAFWLCFVFVICEACASVEHDLLPGGHGRASRQRVENYQSESDQSDSRAYLSSESTGIDPSR